MAGAKNLRKIKPLTAVYRTMASSGNFLITSFLIVDSIVQSSAGS